MPRSHAMLETHPRHRETDTRMLAECIDMCFDCAQVCTTCADACLSESKVAELAQCIRLNLDCADVCQVTGRLLSRMTDAPHAPIRSQLEVCVTACRLCGEECARHAAMHEHCRVCAETCRQCEESCRRMLESIGRRTVHA